MRGLFFKFQNVFLTDRSFGARHRSKGSERSMGRHRRPQRGQKAARGGRRIADANAGLF